MLPFRQSLSILSELHDVSDYDGRASIVVLFTNKRKYHIDYFGVHLHHFLVTHRSYLHHVWVSGSILRHIAYLKGQFDHQQHSLIEMFSHRELHNKEFVVPLSII